MAEGPTNRSRPLHRCHTYGESSCYGVLTIMCSTALPRQSILQLFHAPGRLTGLAVAIVARPSHTGGYCI